MGIETNFDLPPFAPDTSLTRTAIRALRDRMQYLSNDVASRYDTSGQILGLGPNIEIFSAVVFTPYYPSNVRVPTAQYAMIKTATQSGIIPTSKWITEIDTTPGIRLNFIATNYAELDTNGLPTGNFVQQGQQVLVAAVWNRDNVQVGPGPVNSITPISTSEPAYIFYFYPAAWIKITTPMPDSGGMGGGGYYNARSVIGAPVTIDPSTDLVAPQFPNEVVNASDDILAENWSEANLGDPPSHWVPANKFVKATFVGYSNETAPRPVFRFSFEQPIVWLKLIAPVPPNSVGPPPTGGGGYYEAQIVNGVPVTIDPTTDLVAPINPSEVVTSTNPTAALAVNWAEANLGNPPSHWVQTSGYGGSAHEGVFVPAWHIGLSNETVPRPVYRFYIPRPGPVPIKIQPGLNYGSGRYYGATMAGTAVSVSLPADFKSPQNPDNGTSFPGANEQRVAWCNTLESGNTIAPNTWLLGNLDSGGGTETSLVLGVFQGMGIDTNNANALIPIYYGTAPPTFCMFPVFCEQYAGSDGTPISGPTYTYLCSMFTGIIGGGTLNNSVAVAPYRVGAVGFNYYSVFPATFGIGGLDNEGKFFLLWVDERPQFNANVTNYTPVGAWGGAGDPATIQQALDRINAFIGPIP